MKTGLPLLLLAVLWSHGGVPVVSFSYKAPSLVTRRPNQSSMVTHLATPADIPTNNADVKPQRLVIVGGGIGGLSSAYDAHHMIQSHKLEIVVVSDSPTFSFTPSNPWVATRKRKPSDISLPLAEILPKHGIDFVHGRAKRLFPDSKRLHLDSGQDIGYDYLIIATGPRLGLEEIPGLSTSSHFHSVCTTPHADKAASALDDLVQNPRPVVVGATQGASCFGPAYEFVLLLHSELKKRGGQKLVDQCSPISFVTSEPYVGHLGLGGAGDSHQVMVDLFGQRGIRTLPNSRIQHVTKDGVQVEQLDDNGIVVHKEALPSGFTMLIPPFLGHDVWKNVKGLTNKHGMILVNDFQQSSKYPEIFGVGVCVDIPTAEKSVVPIGFPKTGYLIESMGTAAVKNIKAMMRWTAKGSLTAQPKLESRPAMNGLCITDFGDDGAIFVTMPQIRPRRHDWTVHGKVATLAKLAFEKYFLHKIESGDTDPFYEKYFLKLIGVERLE